MYPSVDLRKAYANAADLSTVGFCCYELLTGPANGALIAHTGNKTE